MSKFKEGDRVRLWHDFGSPDEGIIVRKVNKKDSEYSAWVRLCKFAYWVKIDEELFIYSERSICIEPIKYMKSKKGDLNEHK